MTITIVCLQKSFINNWIHVKRHREDATLIITIIDDEEHEGMCNSRLDNLFHVWIMCLKKPVLRIWWFFISFKKKTILISLKKVKKKPKNKQTKTFMEIKKINKWFFKNWTMKWLKKLKNIYLTNLFSKHFTCD